MKERIRSNLIDRVFIVKHPSYDNRYLLNDIAILKLEDYLRPSPLIQFVCLPDNLSDVNKTGIVVGFGDTIPGANRGKIMLMNNSGSICILGSLILKQVNLTIYPNDYCTNVSPSIIKDWNKQICCGDLSGERDACQGDSGGGLYILQNISNRIHYTLDGIVSYGERCASPMKPGIYTRVSFYIDWIQQHSDFQTNNN